MKYKYRWQSFMLGQSHCVKVIEFRDRLDLEHHRIFYINWLDKIYWVRRDNLFLREQLSKEV